DKPVPQTTFIGKTLEAYQMFWREMITHIDNGNNVHHHPGCVSASRGDFLKRVSIPKGILANDHFLYFEALKQGYTFKAAKDAIVYFKVPTTMRDYFKQTTRFYDSADNVKAYFGSWVNTHYDIPRSIKLRAYAVTFFKNPFYLTSALVLQVLQRLFRYQFAEKNTDGIWTPVKSSK
ncbi:MAG: glycosyltransferase family 2 protein, partial [Chitinophagales bacterium]